jgi:uncharacterized membrane protein
MPARPDKLARMIEFHIVAGLLALLAGFVALYARKGQVLHRKSGLVFVAAMTAMLGTGAVMALFVVSESGTGIGALLTLYLVFTSLLTVKRRVDEVRGLTKALAFFALALGGLAIALGVSGVADQASVVFGLVGVLSSAADFRMLARGSIEGTQRLRRHLWRMTFALFIATASFFLGQAKVLPEPMQNFAWLSMPVLAVLFTLFYWLWRTRIRKARAVMPREEVIHG